MSLTKPYYSSSNWLLTKDAWWFFAHPIVYFPLLIFLGGMYFFVPRYGKEKVPFNKWILSSVAILFYFLSTSIFSPCIYGYSKPNLASTLFHSDCFFGIVLAILTYHFCRSLIYIMALSKMSWNITTRFYFAGMAGWAFGGFQGNQTAEVGDEYIFAQYDVNARPHYTLCC